MPKQSNRSKPRSQRDTAQARNAISAAAAIKFPNAHSRALYFENDRWWLEIDDFDADSDEFRYRVFGVSDVAGGSADGLEFDFDLVKED